MSRRLALPFLFITGILLYTGYACWSFLSYASFDSTRKYFARNYGLTLSAPEDYSITFAPLPVIRITGTSLSDNRSLQIKKVNLSLYPDFLSLLMRKYHLDSITIQGGEIFLRPSDDHSLWYPSQMRSGIMGYDKSFPEKISIQESALTIQTIHGSLFYFADCTLTGRWAKNDGKVSLSGTLTWKDVPVTVKDFSFHAKAQKTDQTRAFSFSASSPKATFSLSGHINDQGTKSGSITFAAPSLQDFSQWTGIRHLLKSLPESIAFSTSFSIQNKQLITPDITAYLGNTEFEGSASFSLNQSRLSINSTLATELLDISSYLPIIQNYLNSFSRKRSKDLSIRSYTDIDLDLRLSAGTVQSETFSIKDLATNLLIRQDRLEASIMKAEINKGSVKAKINLTDHTYPNEKENLTETCNPDTDCAKAVSARISGSFENFDFSGFSFLKAYPFLFPLLQSHLSFSLECTDTEIASCLKNQNIQGNLQFKNPVIPGFNPDNLENMQEEEILLDFKKTVPASKLKVDFIKSDAILRFVNGQLSTKKTETDFNGYLSLTNQNFALSGQMKPLDGTPDYSLLLHGSLKEPKLQIKPVFSPPPPEETGAEERTEPEDITVEDISVLEITAEPPLSCNGEE